MLLNLRTVVILQKSKDNRQFTRLSVNVEQHSVKMEKIVLTQELLQAHDSSSQYTKPVEKQKISIANQIMVKIFDGECHETKKTNYNTCSYGKS